MAAGVALAVFALSNLAFGHGLLRFGAPVTTWSDMGGFGVQFGPSLALAIYWTGVCVALLCGLRAWQLVTEAGPVTSSLLRRWRSSGAASPTATGWAGLVAAALAGGWLLSAPSVEDWPDGSHLEGPQPVYSRVELIVEIEPDTGRVRTQGSTVLLNTTGEDVAELHVLVPPYFTAQSFSLTGELLAATADGRHYNYRLNRPLEPNEHLKFAFEIVSRTGVRLPGVVPNGTMIEMRDLLPRFASAVVDAGLLHASDAVGPHSPSNGSWHPATRPANRPQLVRLRIGTSLDQLAVAPGVLEAAWKENGVSYFEYLSGTVPLNFSIHSGRYDVTTETAGNGVALEAYSHPGHSSASMIQAVRKALTETSPPGSEATLRVVEVPDWRPAVRMPVLFGLKVLGRRGDETQETGAGVLPVSELDVTVF